MKMIKLLLSYFAKLLLSIMGWKYPNSKQFDNLNKYDRLVITFSHTTYADFYIIIIYIY